MDNNRFLPGDRVRGRPSAPLAVRGELATVRDIGQARGFNKLDLDNGRRGIVIKDEDLERVEETQERQPAGIDDHW